MKANVDEPSAEASSHPACQPFPNVAQTIPESASILVTDLDLGEIIAPLLDKLPVIRIAPTSLASGDDHRAVRCRFKSRRVNPPDRRNADLSDAEIVQGSVNARRQRARRDRHLVQKMDSGKKHAGSCVVSPADFTDFPTTKDGWAGQDVRYKTDQAWLQKAWVEGTLLKTMLEKGFKTVAFDGRPTWLVDKNGILFGYRTDIPTWMTNLTFDEGTVSLLMKVADQCQKYMADCGDISDKDAEANRRGPHWYHVSGVDRQISLVPKLTGFHVKHRALTDALMADGSPIRRLVGLAEKIFRRVFPWLAARVDNCMVRLLSLGVPSHLAIPQYGCWYNFCINGPRGSVEGVSTRPHADAKNLAIMMCAVFVYGKFNSKEKAWLVLWEAGLIIELPPGVLIFYPSALFTHFNVDLTDLHFVTTADGETPTRKNSSPLNCVKGRGSIVLFNQASLFQLAELGRTVSQAKSAGLSTASNNEEWIKRIPVLEMY